MGKKKTPTPTPKPIPLPGNASAGGGGGGQPQAFAGFQKFAQTGGFSPEDLANIRARAVSPVRAVYANAQREVNRQKSLQGGYSPGFGVLQARMAREQGQGISDAATGAESDIAKMVQSGKLAGLQGMAGTEGSGGGGGGGEQLPQELVPEKRKGFWGKFGTGLKKASQIALPIALSAFAPVAGPIAAKGFSGGLQKVAQAAAGRR